MAAGKTNKTDTKEDASPYFVFRTLDAASRALTESAATGRQQMIDNPIDRGRKLVMQIRKTPRKTLAALVDDGRGAISEIRSAASRTLDDAIDNGKKAAKHPRKTMDEIIADGKTYLVDLKADARKRADGYADNGREAIRGIRTDLDRVIADTKATGRAAIEKIDIRQPVRDRLEQGMQKVPELLNLPSRKEMDALSGSMAEVTSRVESLKKAHAQ